MTLPLYLQDLGKYPIRKKELIVCEHCEALREVLTELTSEKVARVIVKRAAARLHPLDAETAAHNFLVVTA